MSDTTTLTEEEFNEVLKFGEEVEEYMAERDELTAVIRALRRDPKHVNRSKRVYGRDFMYTVRDLEEQFSITKCPLTPKERLELGVCRSIKKEVEKEPYIPRWASRPVPVSRGGHRTAAPERSNLDLLVTFLPHKQTTRWGSSPVPEPTPIVSLRDDKRRREDNRKLLSDFDARSEFTAKLQPSTPMSRRAQGGGNAHINHDEAAPFAGEFAANGNCKFKCAGHPIALPGIAASEKDATMKKMQSRIDSLEQSNASLQSQIDDLTKSVTGLKFLLMQKK